MDLQNLLNKEDEEPLHFKRAAPKGESSSVEQISHSQKRPRCGVTPASSLMDDTVNANDSLGVTPMTRFTGISQEQAQISSVHQLSTYLQHRRQSASTTHPPIEYYSPQGFYQQPDQSPGDCLKSFSDSLSPRSDLSIDPAVRHYAQRSDDDDMSHDSSDKGSPMDGEKPLSTTLDTDYTDEDDHSTAEAFSTTSETSGYLYDDAASVASSNDGTESMASPTSNPIIIECGVVDCQTNSEPRKVVSHFFGRNQAATRRIRDDWWPCVCRKHYQRHRYRASYRKDIEGENYTQQQLELIEGTLNNMEESGEVIGFEIKLKLSARKHYEKTVEWEKACEEAKSNGQRTPTYASYTVDERDKHPNTESFDLDWIIDYLGIGKSFEYVRTFLQDVTEREVIILAARAADQEEQESNGKTKGKPINLPKQELPPFELLPIYRDGSCGKPKPPKRQISRANVKKPAGIQKRKATSASPSSSSSSAPKVKKVATGSKSKAPISRPVRQTSFSPSLDRERTTSPVPQQGDMRPPSPDRERTPSPAPQQGDMGPPPQILSGFTPINQRSQSVLDAARGLVSISQPRLPDPAPAVALTLQPGRRYPFMASIGQSRFPDPTPAVAPGFQPIHQGPVYGNFRPPLPEHIPSYIRGEDVYYS
ncbi:MAG: hypothetical protein MMC33_009206 [Icmadophila ericetorum]|nr:hypothetical protein [Icmadophila ericetorum]